MDPKSLKEGNYFYYDGAIERYPEVQFCNEALRLDFSTRASAISIIGVDLVKLGFNKGESTSGQLTDGFWFEISSDLKGEMYIWQEENGSFYVKYFFRASEGVKRRIESLHNLQNYFKRYGCEQLEIKLNNIHRVDPHLNSIFTQY